MGGGAIVAHRLRSNRATFSPAEESSNMTSISRRHFMSLGAVAAAGGQSLLVDPLSVSAEPTPKAPPGRPFTYTGAGPGRGNPPPHTLKGDDLIRARLTPETWRLEIVGDGCKVETPRKLDDGTAIDFADLLELGKKHGVKFLKAMQCRSGNWPQSHGLWEGVPLREVLKLAGNIDGAMRVYANGFHNNEAKQLFQSSASLTQVLDNAPGELPVMVAYRHNGGPISLLRGGPVRMILPWGYGFKNIKWLQRIRLTNDTKPIDTYGGEPDAYLKTQVPRIEGPNSFKAGALATFNGVAVVGMPGLKRVEYWLRPDPGTTDKLADDDPAWQSADWRPGVVDPPPDDWRAHLPTGISSKELWGFDPQSGKPKDWPLRYTVATWTVTLKDVKPGSYELRVRSVDMNGYAQPQPRPQQPTGRNAIPMKLFKAIE
jgi:DMSO/TMAO reductase YedYZ molybdopterin-dependent catalytic subunit